jgi:hypothetical protein
MTPLLPHELAQFARKYRFAGGRVKRVKVLPRKDTATIEVTLRVTPVITDLGADAPKPVRLVLRVEGAEEYRFQKRLNSAAGRVSDVKFGTFNGLIFINFDAWGLQPGEVPGAHDFRASDAYVAGRRVMWQVLPVKGSPA